LSYPARHEKTGDGNGVMAGTQLHCVIRLTHALHDNWMQLYTTNKIIMFVSNENCFATSAFFFQPGVKAINFIVYIIL
jgi:hypothetical protein